jgi:hypothetical protein
MAYTACLVCFISTLTAASKKEKEKRSLGSLALVRSRHITNLEQSIFVF